MPTKSAQIPRRFLVGLITVACAASSVIAGVWAFRSAQNRDQVAPAEFAFLMPAGHEGETPYLWLRCAAARIGSSYVVTAAHCLSADEFEPMRLVTGPQSLCAPVQNESARLEAKPVMRDTVADIAVLKLEGGAPEPAEDRWKEHTPIPIGTVLEVWGYGAESKSGPRPCAPRKAHQVVVALQECEAAGIATTGKLCVRNSDLSHGVCSGDSGGPVLMGSGRGKEVIGVTSTGRGCELNSLGTVALLPSRLP